MKMTWHWVHVAGLLRGDLDCWLGQAKLSGHGVHVVGLLRGDLDC